MSRPTSLANWASVEFHLFSEYWRDETESQCDEYRVISPGVQSNKLG